MKPIREHDGTNRRGLTARCVCCQTPLIPATETDICTRCLNNAKAVLEQRLKERLAREGKR